MRFRRLAVLLLLTGAATFFVDAATQVPGSATPTTLQLGTASTWVDTGLSFTAGQTLTITATGTVYFRAHNQLPAHPSGHKACFGPPTFTAPGLRCYSLIGEIGTNGTPFEVGLSYSAPAPASGELFLNDNDNENAGNNSGDWTVVIGGTLTATTTPPTTAATPVVATKALAFTGPGTVQQAMGVVGLVLLLIGLGLYFFGDFLGGEVRRVVAWLLR